jgi:hypothetical protein
MVTVERLGYKSFNQKRKQDMTHDASQIGDTIQFMIHALYAVGFREIETTVFDPASEFLQTPRNQRKS